MSKSNALLPIILLEACVTGGRTYHAYKRDGFLEARERFTEETLGALFWFGGVKFFNKLGDSVGKKLLKLNEIKFDASQDNIRKPMVNFIHKITAESGGTIDPKKLEKTLEKFKFGKILASVLLANTFIGFVVPKMNQKITKNYQASLENLNYKHAELLKTAKSMDEFVKKTDTDKKNKKETSFKGQAGMSNLLSIVNLFETNNTCQLLSTDVGVAGGRAINARNKHERIEVLFRDIASIYFYMFCRKHLDEILNKIEDGRTTRLDPMSAQELHQTLDTEWAKQNNKSTKNFKEFVFGKEKNVPENLDVKFNNGIISLDDFVEKYPDKKGIAGKMSKLQPEIQGRAILTESQVEDIFKGGLINDPEFLSKFYTQALDGNPESSGKMIDTVKKWFAKLTGPKAEKPASLTDPMKFISEDTLSGLKNRAKDYLNDIIKKAGKEGNITQELLETMKNKNFLKNTFNLGIGFAVSAYFLSTAIPKIQYWITKKQTGEDRFPGTKTYND